MNGSTRMRCEVGDAVQSLLGAAPTKRVPASYGIKSAAQSVAGP